MTRSPARIRRRNQAGMTLVETLMALTLAVMIMVPMLGWAQFTFSEQVNTQERTNFSNDLSILRTYFHRDVASADFAFVAGDRFVGCATTSEANQSAQSRKGKQSGDSGERLLLVVANDDSLTTYSIAPNSEDKLSVWRNTCTNPGANPSETAELLTDLDPDATDVTCEATRVADGEESCPRVAMSVTTNTSRKATITSMVRSDWVKERSGSDNPDERNPLVSLAATPTRGERNLTVRFSSAGSLDPKGEKLSYMWEFGDSQYSDAANPNHKFTDLGTYTAVLTVTNTSGFSASSFVVVEITNRSPVAVIASPPKGVVKYRGENIAFSSNGSNDAADPAHVGSIVSYSWDFGDGTSSNQANPSKSYGSLSPAGGFNVVLTVTDEDGGVGRAELRVTIANRVPTVSITANPSSGTAPLSTTLTATVTDEISMPSNPELTYLWDFGNSTSSNLASPAPVVYSDSGTYTVKLVVTDDDGATASASQVVTVTSPVQLTYPRKLKVVKLNPQPRLTMSFQWDPVDGADAYWLEVTCGKCSGPIDWIVTGTTATVNIPLANTQYTTRIRARERSSALWGEWSPTIKAKSAK